MPGAVPTRYVIKIDHAEMLMSKMVTRSHLFQDSNRVRLTVAVAFIDISECLIKPTLQLLPYNFSLIPCLLSPNKPVWH